MIITTGPTGRVIQGHLLDVRVKGIEAALKQHDPQLYVRWNPAKLKGWGCWELRRKPEYMSVVDEIEYNGIKIKRLEFAEIDVINHIVDAAFLNYDLVRWVKEADTWNPDHVINDLDYHESKQQAKILDKKAEHLRYLVKHNKKLFRDIRNYMQSGHNPARLVPIEK